MRRLIYISLIFVFSSCIAKSSLNPVFPYTDFNANSAKVWVIQSSSDKKDPNVTAIENYKTCFIFYSNNSFKKQELIHLGSDEGDFGTYQIYEHSDGSFTLKLMGTHSKAANYIIDYLRSDKLILEDIETNVIWEFKTLTPPL